MDGFPGDKTTKFWRQNSALPVQGVSGMDLNRTDFRAAFKCKKLKVIISRRKYCVLTGK